MSTTLTCPLRVATKSRSPSAVRFVPTMSVTTSPTSAMETRLIVGATWADEKEAGRMTDVRVRTRRATCISFMVADGR